MCACKNKQQRERASSRRKSEDQSIHFAIQDGLTLAHAHKSKQLHQSGWRMCFARVARNASIRSCCSMWETHSQIRSNKTYCTQCRDQSIQINRAQVRTGFVTQCPHFRARKRVVAHAKCPVSMLACEARARTCALHRVAPSMWGAALASMCKACCNGRRVSLWHSKAPLEKVLVPVRVWNSEEVAASNEVTHFTAAHSHHNHFNQMLMEA